MRHLTIGLAAFVVWVVGGRALAGTAADAEFFEKKIRPVLAQNCYTCHSASSTKLKPNCASTGLLVGAAPDEADVERDEVVAGGVLAVRVVLHAPLVASYRERTRADLPAGASLSFNSRVALDHEQMVPAAAFCAGVVGDGPLGT
jgi:hypothetical protein